MIRLFYSYSHKDEGWCERLDAHLQALTPKLLATAWYDRKMRPGDEWIEEISEHLDQADIVLLLVSANYFASPFCGIELERAMELHSNGDATVIPVMLSHCNIEESAFAHLNTCPPAERPINSAAWPDKELALKTVSREVARVARDRAEARPRNKLLHVNRKELVTLLHQLCDRSPQRDSLHRALHPDRRKPRRPFVVIIQGRQVDSLEWFISRLENILLPWLLGMKPGRLSPLIWPEWASNKSPADLFGPRLVDCLPVSPYASIPEMNSVLPKQNTVNLLPSSIPASDWPSSGALLFDEYLKLWEQWPQLPNEYALIPILSIEYPIGAPLDGRISERLAKLDLTANQGLVAVSLPLMSDIEHKDFKDWIRHEKVRTKFSSPEKAVDKANEFRLSTFPTAMNPLAEQYLPQFLEQL